MNRKCLNVSCHREAEDAQYFCTDHLGRARELSAEADYVLLQDRASEPLGIKFWRPTDAEEVIQ